MKSPESCDQKQELTSGVLGINFLHLLFSLLSSLETDDPTSPLLTSTRKLPTSFREVYFVFHWERVSKGTYAEGVEIFNGVFALLTSTINLY